MRIIRARHQAELLAAFQRTAGWADWKVTDEWPHLGGGAHSEEARLENGHRLNVSSGTWGSNRPPWRWYWGIYDADDNHVIGSGDHDPPPHSPEEARQAAEAAYQKLFPIGTDTGGHDSGVDYSDLNKFMGEL